MSHPSSSHLSRLRRACLAACLLLAASPAALHALGGRTVLDDGHLDLSFNYTAVGWSTAVVHDDFGTSFPFDQVILHFNSTAFPDGHLVAARPADELWDFLGVDADEPFWNAPPFRPATTAPGAKLLEPGFSTTNTPSALIAAYAESDPRISATPNRWMRIELTGLRHWGATPGHVSLWRRGFLPIVHWSTAQPPAGGDVWFTIPGGHDHMDWGFSHAGIYELDLRATARLTDGNLTPTASDTVTLTVVVGPMPGPYFWWAKTNYSSADWTAGLSAPDQPAASLGLNNAAAYALGLSPNDPAIPPENRPRIADTHAGLAFEFSRPAQAPAGATVEIEHSSDLATWTTLARSVNGGGFQTLAVGATVETSTPDPITQRITITARAAGSTGRDFYRLRFLLD